MKKILLSITCVLCAVVLSVYTAKASGGGDDNDAEVTCRCAGPLGNNQCKASNGQAVCAGGDNIQCQNWNGNC